MTDGRSGPKPKQKRADTEGRVIHAAIIDDDAAVRDSLQLLLEVAGYEAIAYDSARSFLADSTPKPRCLIVDEHMPQMTGLELVARLRREGTLTPVLLITGRLSSEVLSTAEELHVEDVLGKPFEQGDILRFVARFIKPR